MKTTNKSKQRKLPKPLAKPQVESVKAIDCDGTLFKQQEPYSPFTLGPPIPRSVKLVNKWLKENQKIVIFTSRVCRSTHNSTQIRYATRLISSACKHYFGRSFPVTAEKHPSFEIFDNKAHRVETNTGRILAKYEK